MRENLVLEPRYLTVCRSPPQAGNGSVESSDIVSHKSGNFPPVATLCRTGPLSNHTSVSLSEVGPTPFPTTATVAEDAQLLQCASAVHQPPEATGGRTDAEARKRRKRVREAGSFLLPPLTINGDRLNWTTHRGQSRLQLTDCPVQIINLEPVLGPTPPGWPHLMWGRPLCLIGRRLHPCHQSRHIEGCCLR